MVPQQCQVKPIALNRNILIKLPDTVCHLFIGFGHLINLLCKVIDLWQKHILKLIDSLDLREDLEFLTEFIVVIQINKLLLAFLKFLKYLLDLLCLLFDVLRKSSNLVFSLLNDIIKVLKFTFILLVKPPLVNPEPICLLLESL